MGGLLLACRASAPESPPPPDHEAIPAADARVHRASPVDSAVQAGFEAPSLAAEVVSPEAPTAPSTVTEAPRADAESMASAEAAPQPIPFDGKDRITLLELVTELEHVADEIARSPAVRDDYDALVASFSLRDTEALYHDYVRVKLAFEATRDGGLWQLRWDITNEKPNSEQIWKQWRAATVSEDEPIQPTAIAECDELSALFAFVARKLGVRHIGLFWPQWNHVVAVWTVQSADESPVRIVVPTSQIFLTDEDSLGTTGFDPWTQKTIYEYRRRDVKDSHRLDAELARFFVDRARRYGGLPQRELQRLRNERDRSMAQL